MITFEKVGSKEEREENFKVYIEDDEVKIDIQHDSIKVPIFVSVSKIKKLIENYERGFKNGSD